MLLRMGASGASFTDIAAKLGRSQASVESRYSSLKKQTESARSFLKPQARPPAGYDLVNTPSCSMRL